MLIHPDGHEPQDVLMQPHLAFHLRDRGMRRIDIEKLIMTFAVFLHLIGEGAQAPIFGLANGAAAILDDGREGLDHRLDLLRGNIRPRDQYMFIEAHGALSFPVRARRKAPFEPISVKGKAPKDCQRSGDTGARTKVQPQPERRSVQPPTGTLFEVAHYTQKTGPRKALERGVRVLLDRQRRGCISVAR